MYLKDCDSNVFNDNDIDSITKFVNDYNSLLKKEEESNNSKRQYRHMCNTYDELFYSNDCSSSRLKLIKESRDRIHKKAINDLEDFISLDKKCRSGKNELINNSIDYKLERFNELNRDNADLLYKYATLESDIYRSFIIDYDNYVFYREYNKKNGYKYDHDNSKLNNKYEFINKLYNNFEISKTNKRMRRTLEGIYISMSYGFDVQDLDVLLDSDKALVKKKK